MPSLPLHSTKKSLNQIYENFRLQSYKTFPLVNDTIIANNDTITEFMPFHIISIIKTQVSEVKIQYSMPSVQVGLVMPFCDCQQ